MLRISESETIVFEHRFTITRTARSEYRIALEGGYCIEGERSWTAPSLTEARTKVKQQETLLQKLEEERLEEAIDTPFEWRVHSEGFEVEVGSDDGEAQKFQIHAFDTGWGPCTKDEAQDEWAVNWQMYLEITGPDFHDSDKLRSQIMDRIGPEPLEPGFIWP